MLGMLGGTLQLFANAVCECESFNSASSACLATSVAFSSWLSCSAVADYAKDDLQSAAGKCFTMLAFSAKFGAKPSADAPSSLNLNLQVEN